MFGYILYYRSSNPNEFITFTTSYTPLLIKISSSTSANVTVLSKYYYLIFIFIFCNKLSWTRRYNTKLRNQGMYV